MKNIKFLNWALIVFMGSSGLGILVTVYLIWDSPEMRYINKSHDYASYTGILSALVFLCALYQIQQSLAASVKNNFFSYKSSVHLKRGGYILLAYTLLSVLRSIFSVQFLKSDVLIRDFSTHVIFFIIGVALLAVADIIKTGTKIKQENDLTI